MAASPSLFFRDEDPQGLRVLLAGLVARLQFAGQDADDPALPVVRALPARYPQAHIKILVNPLIPGLNGKISNMVHGLKAAAHDVIVFGDSDTRVQPDFLVKMVLPLADDRVGATSCGQINLGGRGFWITVRGN